MKKWQVHEKETYIDTPFVKVSRESCVLPNGATINDYIVNQYPDWVNAVVINKDYEMVLVHQYRHGAREFFSEIPAGKREQGETDIEGVIREVREETGYTSPYPPVLLGEYFVNPAVQTNRVKTYLMLEAEQTMQQKLDKTEDIHIEHVPFHEFFRKCQRGQLQTQLLSMNGYLLARSYLDDIGYFENGEIEI
ncbi:NUDIX hydrolase [Halobacillus salinus]|uniref:NUDIX hydrolase n=1 Tax=Halobacillus salinus TaxID=192814 RepID=A0A4Z0H3J8_9BACI|nr:NUDIX hydrolase [Halobacillus salinus]TGB04427.1 NUDIX hydrolase [Halobacillus salinus]